MKDRTNIWRTKPSQEEEKKESDQELKIKALETTIEWNKQLITLATGTLVISGTFIKDLFSNSISWQVVILSCWISMCFSIFFGVLYMGAAANLFMSKKDLNIMSNPGRILAVLQVMTFFIGLVCFAVFAALNLEANSSP